MHQGKVAFPLGILVWTCLLSLNCGSPQTSLAQLSFPDLEGLEHEAKVAVTEKQEAVTAALKSEKSDSQKAMVFGELGTLYFAFGFHESAQICFENAAILEPENHHWPYYLGRLPNRDHPAIQKSLERVLELEPNHVASKVALGQVYLQTNREQEAEQLFEEAIIEIDDHPVANFQLGLLALAGKEYQAAIDHFRKTLSADPRAAAVHYQLALALRHLGLVEAAKTQITLRGDRPPTSTDPLMDAVLLPSALAHYRLAESLRLSGNNKDAIPHYDQTVELIPKSLGPRVGRVLNLVQQGQDTAALIRLRDDLKLFPNNGVLLHILARLLAASAEDQIRDGQKSLQLMHILGKGAVTAEMVETLAMAFAEVGDFKQAISFQERALSVTDDSDPSFFQRLQTNLAGYHQKKPCRQPWQPEDPIFRLNTYAATQQIPTLPEQEAESEAPN